MRRPFSGAERVPFESERERESAVGALVGNALSYPCVLVVAGVLLLVRVATEVYNVHEDFDVVDGGEGGWDCDSGFCVVCGYCWKDGAVYRGARHYDGVDDEVKNNRIKIR